jgi:hypothetical protein
MIAAALSTCHDRDCHGGIVTTRPLMLTVVPAWCAPRPHPALGAQRQQGNNDDATITTALLSRHHHDCPL